MQLLQLEYFLKVARCGNVNTAAKEMNVSPSSVSRCISRLEEDLGFPLFERVGRNIALNSYGETFYQYAEQSLQMLEDGKMAVQEQIAGSSDQLSFSVPVPRLSHRPLIQFAIDHPDVKIRQRLCPDNTEVKELIEQGRIDFALSYSPIEDNHFQWERILLEHFYFIVRKDHPLANRKSISLKDLDGVRVVMNESDDPDKILESCQLVGAKPEIVFCGNEIIGLGMLIQNGLGGAFIPAYSQYEREQEQKDVLREMNELVSIMRIEEDWFTRELGVITFKHRYLPAPARELCNYLKNYFREIAPALRKLGNTEDN